MQKSCGPHRLDGTAKVDLIEVPPPVVICQRRDTCQLLWMDDSGLLVMCGIAGIVHPKGRQPDRSILAQMITALNHRGPDESGIFIDDEAGLAHARLSIVDLAGGRQPMSVAGGELWITYNGEVFNFVELREEMESEGVRFATRSDTEVVLRSFHRHGADCVHDFNGQWAFAVWDTGRRELFLSRDRVGIRPLYYTVVDGSLIFASEIKAILCHPSVSRCLDLQGLDQVFTCWHPLGERTLLRGIRALPPGCNLRFRDGRVSIQRYWSFEYPRGSPSGFGGRSEPTVAGTVD